MIAGIAAVDLPPTPALDRLVARLLDLWPEHRPYVEQRFAAADPEHLATCELVADRIWKIIGGDPDTALHNYRWTCRMMLDEEYHFRRTGRYRHTSFEQVRSEVYDDAGFMARYTDGLLLSQLLWSNHTRSLHAYRTTFLAGLDPDAELLEVGPGHGLLIGLAAERQRGAVTGWDISATSLAMTARALRAMGAPPVRLEHRDVLDAPPRQRFDAVVASELLEHLERPDQALGRLRAVTRPGGRLFLNVPVNSPAPDHITLWRAPEQIHDLVRAAGLRIEHAWSFPMTGKTTEQARKDDLTMSCVIICRRGREPGR